ncbi:MAG TPA: hypothetical protein VIP70_09770 [Nitrososphaeraceae archaeon]
MCEEMVVDESKIFLENNGNNISLEIVEFCIIDDETVNYFKKKFANMKI